MTVFLYVQSTYLFEKWGENLRYITSARRASYDNSNTPPTYNEASGVNLHNGAYGMYYSDSLLTSSTEVRLSRYDGADYTTPDADVVVDIPTGFNIWGNNFKKPTTSNSNDGWTDKCPSDGGSGSGSTTVRWSSGVGSDLAVGTSLYLNTASCPQNRVLNEPFANCQTTNAAQQPYYFADSCYDMLADTPNDKYNPNTVSISMPRSICR